MRRQSDRRGLVLLELALILPLLLALTFGLIEYGWLFIKQHQITNAARQGARIGATPDATNADVQAAVTDIMNGAGMGGSGYTVTFAPANVQGINVGDPLKITVSVPYANIHLIGLPFIPVPVNLQSATSMAKEGP